MWISEDGRVNTNAVANPEMWIDSDLKQQIKRSNRRTLRELDEFLEDYTLEYCEKVDINSPQTGSAPYEWPPDDLLVETVSPIGTPLTKAVLSAIETLPWMWRFDAALIIQDYVSIVLSPKNIHFRTAEDALASKSAVARLKRKR